MRSVNKVFILEKKSLGQRFQQRLVNILALEFHFSVIFYRLIHGFLLPVT